MSKICCCIPQLSRITLHIS